MAIVSAMSFLGVPVVAALMQSMSAGVSPASWIAAAMHARAPLACGLRVAYAKGIHGTGVAQHLSVDGCVAGCRMLRVSSTSKAAPSLSTVPSRLASRTAAPAADPHSPCSGYAAAKATRSQRVEHAVGGPCQRPPRTGPRAASNGMPRRSPALSAAQAEQLVQRPPERP